MKLKFDSKWLILFVVLVSVTTMTILMNKTKDSTVDTITSTIEIDNDDTTVDWDALPTKYIELNETLNITQSGIYHLSGIMNDGYIYINSDDTANIKIILDNASIKNTTGPAIYCESAGILAIELIGENTIEDGSARTDTEDTSGAIFSESDLIISGDGKLKVIANYQDGIVSKDNLKIKNGILDVTSNDDGIRGTDSVYILGGDFTIESTGDSIKTTNETDSRKGFILIENGNFSLKSNAKGIKATNKILIHAGHYLISTEDDAIHSNGYLMIADGVIDINSRDDAMHADKSLIINGGEINVASAYEGIEAQSISINGGSIKLATIDDGVNAGGGSDASSMNRPGANPFDGDEDCVITISDGDIYINSAGDGIDSNGWLYINGGNIVVDGPTNNGNGALDAGLGIIMKGGQVIAIGASGMAESLGENSSIMNASIFLNATEAANTEIEIRDLDNNILISHTSAKSFNHIAVGLKEFAIGNTYTLYLNGKKQLSFTLSGITTIVGEKSRFNRPQ